MAGDGSFRPAKPAAVSSDAQQSFDAALQDDHVGRSLHGAVVTNLKIGAVFARLHDFTRLRSERVGFGLAGLAAAGKSFVDFDNESGDLFEPGEVGVAEHEGEQGAGARDGSVDLLVFGALAIEKELV